MIDGIKKALEIKLFSVGTPTEERGEKYSQGNHSKEEEVWRRRKGKRLLTDIHRGAGRG